MTFMFYIVVLYAFKFAFYVLRLKLLHIQRISQQENPTEFPRYQLTHINVFLQINLPFDVSIVFVLRS
jgi:hypothetical protein